MKIDLYTKGILTVIAVALVIIVAKDINLVDKAYAHDGLTHDEVMYRINLYTLDDKQIDAKVKKIVEGCTIFKSGTARYIRCLQ
tara:strand:- start:27 stop:278 length:252 start_codon:yes stop_codon:yes gene_type:complete